jgi:hypothetical protein
MVADARLIKKIEIPQINYPKEVTTELKKLGDYLTESIQNNYESIVANGKIPLPELPFYLKWRLVFFLWIAETNEIINNLNLILSDLHDFTNIPTRFSGNPRERIYFFMRMFFYEFSRIKDVFARFTKALRHSNIIQKDTVKFLREEFNQIFQEGIVLRNKMVHERFSLPGKENLDLIVVSTVN